MRVCVRLTVPERASWVGWNYGERDSVYCP
jgi:hypothetical protein